MNIIFFSDTYSRSDYHARYEIDVSDVEEIRREKGKRMAVSLKNGKTFVTEKPIRFSGVGELEAKGLL